jgi:intergrase/recombinase
MVLHSDINNGFNLYSEIINPLISNFFEKNDCDESSESENYDKNLENCSCDNSLQKDNYHKSLKLNDVWFECKSYFEECLCSKKISETTKRDYFNALLRFFENRIISKPIEFRDVSLKDKEKRGLRNLFNYFFIFEINEICGYRLEKWRCFVKIKRSGVVEVYVDDE